MQEGKRAARRPERLSAVLAAAAISTLVLLNPAPASAADRSTSFADMSIEELMNVEVVSLSKKAQRLSDSPAALFVISADDIHRSGATNVPELLRMVPGVDVAWIGGGAYSVTIRGFADRFSNKLLVLRDGRSLYTSLFAGVFWERELPMLRDIERIEIIRGPGAAVWGANAVNGVINIITQSSRDTTGGFVETGGGDHAHQFGSARYGWQVDDHDFLRVYARGAHEHPGSDLAGASGMDAINNGSAGLRFDRKAGPDTLSLQAEGYNAYSSQGIEVPVPAPPYLVPGGHGQRFQGAFALGHYEHELAGSDSITVQASYDFSDIQFDQFGDEERRSFSVEAQHHVSLGATHDIVWGANIRSDADHLMGSQVFSVIPVDQRRNTASLLAQDEIRLIPDRLRLTIGSIFEYDSIAGTHAMPDLRLAWNPTATSTLWGAVSRALRAPSRAEQDIRYLLGPTIPAAPPFQPLAIIPVATGTPTYGVEQETAYQIGYRIEPGKDLSVDLAAFTSHYADLRTNYYDLAHLVPAQVFGVPYLQLPIEIINGQTATSRGIETAVDWRIFPHWRLQWAAAYLDVAAGNSNIDFEGIALNAPKFSTSLHSALDLGPANLDVMIRRVGALTIPSFQVTEVSNYTTADVRLAWHVTPAIELAINARNLFAAHHLEFISSNLVTVPRQIDRTVYASAAVSW